MNSHAVTKAGKRLVMSVRLEKDREEMRNLVTEVTEHHPETHDFIIEEAC